MTEKKATRDRDPNFAYYMDLLSHDVVNNNQAVLGYLELILASGGLDKKARKYAEKAVSHIRTSTILVDNVKRLMITRDMDPADFKPVDLMVAMNRAEREVSRMFPDKSFNVKLPSDAAEMKIIGDGAAEDLILNMMVTMVWLDPSETITLVLKTSETEVKGKKFWQITLEDPTARMPKMAVDRPLEDAFKADSSIAVKVVGMLFCKMISEMLGGGFEVHELNKKADPRGAAFVATLRKAGGQ